ncbi:hypothetical protein C8R44DRAFT_831617 [Mycena epipterygia]|nr:hypothetical protein C8R44DRAFT_831617 [Mycena epipterygia]
MAPIPSEEWDAAGDTPFPFAQEEIFTFDEGHPVEAPARGKRESDNPLRQWSNGLRQTFVDECLRLEGRGDHRHQTRCSNCPAGLTLAVYRCQECFTDALFCKECLVLLHKDNPFHRVEVWADDCFTLTTLKSLGRRIQLGHGRNGTCPGTLVKQAAELEAAALPGYVPKHDNFCIVDSNGIHEVGLDFCSCVLRQTHNVQLLRTRLYPATTTNPATASTFRAKCSAHHFYNSLARLTNNNGVFQPRNRYNEFRRMTREWRHIQMLKRAGRGHAADGVERTKEGECALLCPACPQLGKNLPESGERFLYALFLAIDANFRMKRKHVSSEEDDPSLGDGIAFFGKVEEYMQHLDKHWDFEQETKRSDVQYRKAHSYGTASSGIGTVDCARHNMKCPNGVGDLQKGERYINMDYMLWKSLAGCDDLVQLFISYDIICQWHKNIWRRLVQYKPVLRGWAGRSGERFFVWLIPKFHLPAHIEACNILFSFNLTPFVGQTDGEASDTNEMGPGACRDTLDDHFNDWNHKKIVGLGGYLLDRVQKAVANMLTCRLALLEAEDGLPPDVVTGWTAAMELWELDSANPNPFQVMEKHELMYAIWGRIAVEVEGSAEGDQADDVRGDLHASEMIKMSLQLEEQQRALELDTAAVKLHATDRQKTALRERSNKLLRKIAGWVDLQASFTPAVTTLRTADEKVREEAARLQPITAVPVHAFKLWLPSKLVTTLRIAVKDTHARYEFELRIGQAHAALEELRRLLLVHTAQYKYKDDNARGVAANTRAKTSIKNIDELVRLTLSALGAKLKEHDWKKELRVLTPDDVRGRPRGTFSDPTHKQRNKKRKTEADVHVEERRKEEERPASWIWLSQLSLAEDMEKGMTEALRIEWAKTRVRAWRWTEEVDLREEEMRCMLQFLDWKAAWWLTHIDQRPVVVEDETMREGFKAYACCHSRMQRSLKSRFEGNWKDVAQYIELGQAGLEQIPEDDEQGAEGQAERDTDVDVGGDVPVPEVARDTEAIASFVEESLA